MREETYGWNLEMQMRAARAGLRYWRYPSITAAEPVANQRCQAHCVERFSQELAFW
jgi:hypothetical protein